MVGVKKAFTRRHIVCVLGCALGRVLGCVAAFACLIATPAFAERVPLPKPRPAAARTSSNLTASTKLAAATATSQASHALAAQPSAPANPTQAPITQAASPFSNPFAGLLGKPASSGNNTFTPEQTAIVEKVNSYLSNTQMLSGNFVQVGPDGRRTKGDFYISKPGKVRFVYEEPNPIELIADGQSVVVRDRKLATQDLYPLSQTPLRFLLSNHVDLIKDAKLVSVSADDVFVTVVAEEKNAVIGTSRLMIMFGAKDMQLKQWTVTDPQGYDTTVAVYNLDTSKKPDPNLFRIDYTSYHN